MGARDVQFQRQGDGERMASPSTICQATAVTRQLLARRDHF